PRASRLQASVPLSILSISRVICLPPSRCTRVVALVATTSYWSRSFYAQVCLDRGLSTSDTSSTAPLQHLYSTSPVAQSGTANHQRPTAWHCTSPLGEFCGRLLHQPPDMAGTGLSRRVEMRNRQAVRARDTMHAG